MSYEKSPRGHLTCVPDVITITKHNAPPLIRQLVSLLLQYQDALAAPTVKTIYIHLRERPDPVIRLSSELS